jgi:hypothetical protein
MSKIPSQDNACVFFGVKRIMSECVPSGQTVNQKYKIELLSKLRERIRWKGQQMGENGWGLQEDIASPNNAISI